MTKQPRSTPLRVLYLAGYGDASLSLKAFGEGRLNPDIGHVGYSDQMFRVCDELGVELLALSTNPRAQDRHVRNLRTEPRPDPLKGRSGVGYHLAHVALAAQIMRDVQRFRANVVIVPFEPYAFLLAPLVVSGVKIVQSLHCVLWPAFRPQAQYWKILRPLLRRMYRSGISAVLSASDSITSQVDEIGGASSCPVVEFLPTFRRDAFVDINPPEWRRRPFRVMFVGRFETDKGVLALLEVARHLKRMGRTDIVIDMCGDGSALAGVREIVSQEGLGEIYVLHGWCMADRLRELSGTAHVFVVPTTTGFVEGFNHAVVEGVLAGRPVITSRVCPAASYVPSCVRLVPPDDVEGYLQAVLDLADDEDTFERLQRSCGQSAERFLNSALGFGDAVKGVLTALHAGGRPARRSIPLDPARPGAR